MKKNLNYLDFPMAMIAIDLDDTLVDLFPNLVNYINIKYSTDFVIEDFCVFEFWDIVAKKVPGYSESNGIRDIYEFSETPEFDMVQPIEGAQEAVGLLKEIDDMMIITARSDRLYQKTERCIDMHFYSSFQEIFYTNGMLGFEKNVTKGEAALIKGARLGIDDGAHNVIDYAKKGIPSYLFGRTWNKKNKAVKEFDLINHFNYWNCIYNHIAKGKYY